MNVSVNLREVPAYIRDSTLFSAFNDTDEERFEIPKNCYKSNSVVETTADLFNLLRTIRFWGISKVPVSIYEYIIGSENLNVDDIRMCSENVEEQTEYLQMLMEIRVTPHASRIETIIASYPNRFDVEVLQYLVDSGCELKDESELAAVKSGNILFLQWIQTARETTDSSPTNLPRLTAWAAVKGRLPMLKYLHEKKYIWDEGVIAAAAQGGHLHCLQFAHENGCPWDFRTLHNAAVCGHLPCLQYAYENGCTDWGPTTGSTIYDTTALVAAAGHLECLKYVHQHGCPWHHRTAHRALRRGQWWCAVYAGWYLCSSVSTGSLGLQLFSATLCIIGCLCNNREHCVGFSLMAFTFIHFFEDLFEIKDDKDFQDLNYIVGVALIVVLIWMVYDIALLMSWQMYFYEMGY